MTAYIPDSAFSVLDFENSQGTFDIKDRVFGRRWVVFGGGTDFTVDYADSATGTTCVSISAGAGRIESQDDLVPSFGKADFTVRAHFKVPTGSTLRTIFSCLPTAGAVTGGFTIGIDAAGLLYLWRAGSYELTSVSRVDDNTWREVELVRSKGVTTLRLGGVTLGSFPDTMHYTIGEGGYTWGNIVTNYDQPLTGKLDNLMITVGSAEHTSDYTPDWQPLPTSKDEPHWVEEDMTDVRNLNLRNATAFSGWTEYGDPVIKRNENSGGYRCDYLMGGSNDADSGAYQDITVPVGAKLLNVAGFVGRNHEADTGLFFAIFYDSGGVRIENWGKSVLGNNVANFAMDMYCVVPPNATTVRLALTARRETGTANNGIAGISDLRWWTGPDYFTGGTNSVLNGNFDGASTADWTLVSGTAAIPQATDGLYGPSAVSSAYEQVVDVPGDAWGFIFNAEHQSRYRDRDYARLWVDEEDDEGNKLVRHNNDGIGLYEPIYALEGRLSTLHPSTTKIRLYIFMYRYTGSSLSAGIGDINLQFISVDPDTGEPPTTRRPLITSQPSSIATRSGGAVTFSVSATPSLGSLSYQWHEDGVGPIADAITPHLTVAAELVNAGSGYYAVVSDEQGSTTSEVAVLTITDLSLKSEVTPTLLYSGVSANAVSSKDGRLSVHGRHILAQVSDDHAAVSSDGGVTWAPLSKLSTELNGSVISRAVYMESTDTWFIQWYKADSRSSRFKRGERQEHGGLKWYNLDDEGHDGYGSTSLILDTEDRLVTCQRNINDWGPTLMRWTNPHTASPQTESENLVYARDNTDNLRELGDNYIVSHWDGSDVNVLIQPKDFALPHATYADVWPRSDLAQWTDAFKGQKVLVSKSHAVDTSEYYLYFSGVSLPLPVHQVVWPEEVGAPWLSVGDVYAMGAALSVADSGNSMFVMATLTADDTTEPQFARVTLPDQADLSRGVVMRQTVGDGWVAHYYALDGTVRIIGFEVQTSPVSSDLRRMRLPFKLHVRTLRACSKP